MYWLRRPPYLRWILAGAVLCFGLYLDLRPAAAVTYPFAVDSILAGEDIGSIEWRLIPPGLLPEWDGSPDGIAVVDIDAGTPLLPQLVADVSIPPGWWSVSLPLPQPATPGTPVRIALDGQSADGIVAGGQVEDVMGITVPVAFPPAQASLVAAIMADTRLVVMVGSTTAP